MKRVGFRRKPGHKDPVTSELHAAVLVRDRQCVASKFDPTHGCRDTWGTPHAPDRLDLLQLDHVHESYGMAGKRAASSLSSLVSVCAHAHLNGWSTSKANRALVRWYLGGKAA